MIEDSIDAVLVYIRTTLAFAGLPIEFSVTPTLFSSAGWPASTTIFIKVSVSTISTNFRVALAFTGILIEVFPRPPTGHSTTWWDTNAVSFVKVSITAISINFRVAFAVAGFAIEVIPWPPTGHSTAGWDTNTV